MTLTELETEVLPTLTLSERLRLIRRLATDVDAEDATGDIDEAEEARWDAQLREDIAAGRHESMLKKAREEYARGECLPDWP